MRWVVSRQENRHAFEITRSLRSCRMCVPSEVVDVAGTDTEDGDDTGTAAEDAVGAGVIEMVGRRSSSTRFTKED